MNKTSSDAVEYHDKSVAKNWNDKYQLPTFQLRVEIVKKMLSDVAIDGQYWLDAGCGTGVMSRLLAENGSRVLGVDASHNMLEVAKLSSTGCDERVSYVHIDSIESLPFEDGQFDGVVCSSVLEYVDDPKHCLTEFSRVLRPGGCLILSVPNSRSVIRQLHGVRYYIARGCGKSQSEFYGYSRNSYTRKSIRLAIVASGLLPEQTVQLGAILPFFGICRSDLVSPLIFTLAKKK